MITLSRITVFPIKSLDGVDLPAVEVLASGAIDHDRRFALVDKSGKHLNGKRTAAVHSIRAKYDLQKQRVWLQQGREGMHEFSLKEHHADIAAWLSERTQTPCSLSEDTTHGFPDDTDAPGPTLVSTQTLTEVARWFDLPVDECRRRLRTNLEIDAPHPFWEDQLVGRDFPLGGIVLHGTGVCQRCVVPARDSTSGAATKGFQARFAKLRSETLPAASPREAFNHFYRVAVNTRLSGGAGRLKVGDSFLGC